MNTTKRFEVFASVVSSFPTKEGKCLPSIHVDDLNDARWQVKQIGLRYYLLSWEIYDSQTQTFVEGWACKEEQEFTTH